MKGKIPETLQHTPHFHEEDYRFMQLALYLAQRGLGSTAPNPSVGCVIVNNGIIVGRGTTAPGGRPHAETVALAQAGSKARGATVYVTLEPCCHVGKTRPCTEPLIEAGVTRVVVAIKDKNPAVSGGGIASLQQAGITVDVGLLSEEASAMNAGFFSVHQRARPWVTVKLATSLDGKIALANGESRWITGPEARRYAHLLRAQHDAIMVGAGTVKADDPELTCRLPGMEAKNPVRVIMDSRTQLPANCKLFTTANQTPTWVVTRKQQGDFPDSVKALTAQQENAGYINAATALSLLAAQGITRLLVEGGSKLVTSLWQADMIDQLIWIRAPKVLGNDSRPAIDALQLSALQNTTLWHRKELLTLGPDCCEIFTKA